MSPSDREREYQKRRYDEWQKRLEKKKAERGKRNRLIAVVASAVGVLAIGFGVLWLTTGGDDGTDTASTAGVTPSATAQASPSVSASPSTSASPSPSVKNPCPPSTANTAATPKSWSDVPEIGETKQHTYKLVLNTSCGDITATLDGTKAPQAVASTVFLVQNGFYTHTPCHRLVTEGIYVLQCGDPTGTGSGGPGYNYGPVENAPADQVYKKGVLAMARASEETSQGSQFFIVYKDSPIPGKYTVIGQVTQGLDVVQKIADGGVQGGGSDGAPNRPVSIKAASVTQN